MKASALFDLRSLYARLVLSFIAVILLSSAAIGGTVLWLVRDMLNRQVWTLAKQGAEFSRELYAEQQSQLVNLALLTSQRPTLTELVETGSVSELSPYLESLRSSVELDLIVVCFPSGAVLSQAGTFTGDAVCAQSELAPILLIDTPGGVQAAMLSAQPLAVGEPAAGRVFVGRILDQDLLRQITTQTGLEQTLLVGDRPIAASYAELEKSAEIVPGAVSITSGADASAGAVQSGDFFSIRFPLREDSQVEAVVSLPVAEYTRIQQRLSLNILAGIAVFVILGSVTGLLVARAISRPLEQLSRAAARIERGNLTKPVAIHTRFPEIARVGYALEDARSALHHTLKELNEEKAWTDHLLHSIVEGIITVDAKGRINYFSPGAERITGLRKEEAVGRLCDDVFTTAESGDPFTRLLPSPGGHAKIVIHHRDGRNVTLAVTGAVLAPPGTGKAWTALVLRDVSDEEAIRRLLGDFLANITHEFRTPLAAVAASIELLLEQLDDLSREEIEELLATTRLGILALQTLINNLLEGASIETGRFRVSPKPSDFRAVLLETVQIILPLVQKYGQTLVIDVPEDLPPLLVDPRRTGQVLVNLISNAVKYSPKETEIKISVAHNGDSAVIRIADQGPSVPPGQRENLFQRFAQLEIQNERVELGAGLGLSVVKAIVEAQGGEVGMEDNPGGGAVFWFTAPFAEQAQQPAPSRLEGEG